ncbi:hypothetical protein [Metallosphaera hakonensis]|uniref:Uncharacterized protein n=1 Tax=Metallosphaera hakonensis JCM 8857 = DSM 7519 TaxID=1293036 RepID=A0A2U9IUN1_9CREN|nr:hypothetical protein [Metallosphaera hakonensis]AWR99685.1 hypothetical protein DFR87_08275 [Metallosphaera hakonensis JCM 8857 = DSM 7519]
MEPIKVKLSTGKEITIDDNTVSVLNRYARTLLTLEGVAKELNLSGWEEAYELIKAVPSWILWTPLEIYKRSS